MITINLHIGNMSGLNFGSKFYKSMTSWCLDTNHFAGTPPAFRIIIWIFTFLLGGGGGGGGV